MDLRRAPRTSLSDARAQCGKAVHGGGNRLLRRIDANPETKQLGRSAFVRHAVELYLRAGHKLATDAAIRRAYGKRDAALEDEIVALMGAQAWPDE